MGHHGPEVTFTGSSKILSEYRRLYLPNSEVWRDPGPLSESCTLSVMIWFKLYNNTYTGRQSSSDCRPWNTSLSEPSSRMWTEWSWSTFWLWRTPRSRGVGVVPRSRGVGVVSYSGVSSEKKNKSGVHWKFLCGQYGSRWSSVITFSLMNKMKRVLAFKMYFRLSFFLVSFVQVHDLHSKIIFQSFIQYTLQLLWYISPPSTLFLRGLVGWCDLYIAL